MTRFNCFIWINIHDLCNADHGFRIGKIAFVEMGMPVKMVAGFGNADQPVQCLQPLWAGSDIIVDAKWWRMADENIQCAAILHAVKKQAGSMVKARK